MNFKIETDRDKDGNNEILYINLFNDNAFINFDLYLDFNKPQETLNRLKMILEYIEIEYARLYHNYDTDSSLWIRGPLDNLTLEQDTRDSIFNGKQSELTFGMSINLDKDTSNRLIDIIKTEMVKLE